jgi:hypothetical protein
MILVGEVRAEDAELPARCERHVSDPPIPKAVVAAFVELRRQAVILRAEVGYLERQNWSE